MMVDAYPLNWPVGWPRKAAWTREYSRFKTTFAKARDEIIREVRLLGGANIIISTNIPLRQDGLPYATYREPEDTGIAVYFMMNGEQQCFPCDKWKRIEDNMHAVQLTISALRGIERWGSGEMMKASFTGFKALPPPPSKEYFKDCRDEAEIRARYKELCLRLHPDRGGDHTEFADMQEQFNKLLKERD